MKVSSNNLAVIRPKTSFSATLNVSAESGGASTGQAQHIAPFFNLVNHKEKKMVQIRNFWPII